MPDDDVQAKSVEDSDHMRSAATLTAADERDHIIRLAISEAETAESYGRKYEGVVLRRFAASLKRG